MCVCWNSTHESIEYIRYFQNADRQLGRIQLNSHLRKAAASDPTGWHFVFLVLAERNPLLQSFNVRVGCAGLGQNQRRAAPRASQLRLLASVRAVAIVDSVAAVKRMQRNVVSHVHSGLSQIVCCDHWNLRCLHG